MNPPARHLSLAAMAIAALSVAALAGLGAAYADALQTQAFGKFHLADHCVAAATAKYPDHDLKALRARDKMVDSCLAQYHLPPRAHLAPDADPPAKP
jgi:hypothetical protein